MGGSVRVGGFLDQDKSRKSRFSFACDTKTINFEL